MMPVAFVFVGMSMIEQACAVAVDYRHDTACISFMDSRACHDCNHRLGCHADSSDPSVQRRLLSLVPPLAS